MNNHFSSIVPVFGSGDDLASFHKGDRAYYMPFRNKFCSKCFRVKKEMELTYWGLSIACEHKISVNHENFLHVDI